MVLDRIYRNIKKLNASVGKHLETKINNISAELLLQVRHLIVCGQK